MESVDSFVLYSYKRISIEYNVDGGTIYESIPIEFSHLIFIILFMPSGFNAANMTISFDSTKYKFYSDAQPKK